MRLTRARILKTAPTADVVTLDEAKAHLRVEFPDDDVLIGRVVATAVAQLDPAGGGWLGRALAKQTWEYRLSFGFPLCDIELPYPPLIRVNSVKYIDVNGVEQTLTQDVDYRVLNLGGRGLQRIARPYGKAWPPARPDVETVRIEYDCGYANEANKPAPVPFPVKAWLLLAIGHLYANREALITGQRAAAIELPNSETLLTSQRVYGPCDTEDDDFNLGGSYG